MDDDRRSRTGTLAVLLAATCFGTLGPVSRLAYEHGMTPLAFVTWRAAIGAILVVAIVVARSGGRLPWSGLRGLSVRARASLTVAALTGLALNLAMFTAFDRIAIALALLGFYTYPVMVMLVVAALERRHPARAELIALVMAVTGMAIVVVGQMDPTGGLRVDAVGLVLVLFAAAAQTVFVTVSRRGYPTIPIDQATAFILTADAVIYLAVALIAGVGASIVLPINEPATWPLLLLGGVLGAGIPSLLFLAGIRLIGGVRTGILAMWEPVTGTILAAVVLGELLKPVQVAGGVLVIAAAILLQVSAARSRSAFAPSRALRASAPSTPSQDQAPGMTSEGTPLDIGPEASVPLL